MRRDVNTKYLTAVITLAWWLAIAPGAVAPAHAAVDDPREQAMAACESGYSAYRRGDFASALAAWKKAVAYEPNLVKAHYWLGKLYRETGHLDEAIHHWEEACRLRRLIADRHLALDLDNNEVPSDEQLVAAHDRQKQAREAYNKGRSLLSEGQWAAALASFHEAVDAYPAHPDYLLALARAQWDSHDQLGAVHTYTDLIDAGETSHAVASEAVARMITVGQTETARTFVRRLPTTIRVAVEPLLDRYDAQVASAQPRAITPGLGSVISRRDGQVVIDLGFNQGFKLSDEFALPLRVVHAGTPLEAAPGGLPVGRTPTTWSEKYC